MTKREQQAQYEQYERAFGSFVNATYWSYVWFSALVKGYDAAAVTA